MRHLAKWLMTLSLLATFLAMTNVALWGDSRQEIKQRNQTVANEVAKALQDAKLRSYGIGIEITGGTAKLTGEVTDATQKVRASKVTSKVRGVRKIDNRLKVTPSKVRFQDVDSANNKVRASQNAAVRQVSSNHAAQEPANVQYRAIRQQKQRQLLTSLALGIGNALSNPPHSNSVGALGVNRYDPNSLANPYGAGSPYKVDGLMNPYSEYGSPYSNKSWKNPYATDAPKLYDSHGKYHGKLSANPYDPDSTSNPYGIYGSPYSPDSINNKYGAGNPYSTEPIYVVPSE